MSTWVERGVHCPKCSRRFMMRLADGLHISRLPEVRRRVREGTFHQAACPSCGALVTAQVQTVYTDFERRHWLHVDLPSERSRWPELEAKALGGFDGAVRLGAPPMVRVLADSFRVRLVFGYPALREKILLWDADMDDGLVECLKLELIRARPTLMAGGGELVVDEVLDGQQLVMVTQGGVAPARLTLQPGAYARAEASRAAYEAQVPSLFGPGFVSLHRLI